LSSISCSERDHLKFVTPAICISMTFQDCPGLEPSPKWPILCRVGR